MVTKRAFGDHAVKLIEVPAGGRVTHQLRVPPGLCPVSHNPLEGSLWVSYPCLGQVLEVVTLQLEWEAVLTASRSAEGLLHGLRGRLPPLEGMQLRLRLVLSPGPQVLEVTW